MRAYCRPRIGPVTERARACGRLRADHRPPTCTERPTGRLRALAARRRHGAGETAADPRRLRQAMDRCAAQCQSCAAVGRQVGACTACNAYVAHNADNAYNA